MVGFFGLFTERFLFLDDDDPFKSMAHVQPLVGLTSKVPKCCTIGMVTSSIPGVLGPTQLNGPWRYTYYMVILLHN